MKSALFYVFPTLFSVQQKNKRILCFDKEKSLKYLILNMGITKKKQQQQQNLNKKREEKRRAIMFWT